MHDVCCRLYRPSLTRHTRGGCAGLLRCGKGTTWEGGVRVPTFVHWKGHIQPGYSSQLASTLDVVPTVLSIVKSCSSPDKDQTAAAMTEDGFDLSPVLFENHTGNQVYYSRVTKNKLV